MLHHIILTAFGTTTRARDAYHHLEEQISRQFHDHIIHWAYSSPTVRKLSHAGDTPFRSISEIIDPLDNNDVIVVQSLHILPGLEFERITDEVSQAGIRAALGRPLLNDSSDLRRLSACLRLLIENSDSDAVLLLGHGTNHPSRDLFNDLEQMLVQKFGTRIFLSTLEFPDESPEAIAARIAAGDYRKVLIIPILLVAGMHFFRDITGENDDSWKNVLISHDIELEIHDHGLAKLPGIADIFCDHIRNALAMQSS